MLDEEPIFDGLTVDADGNVWVALFGGGRIHGFAPDATLIEVIEVPAQQVTALTFSPTHTSTKVSASSAAPVPWSTRCAVGICRAAMPSSVYCLCDMPVVRIRSFFLRQPRSATRRGRRRPKLVSKAQLAVALASVGSFSRMKKMKQRKAVRSPLRIRGGSSSCGVSGDGSGDAGLAKGVRHCVQRSVPHRQGRLLASELEVFDVPVGGEVGLVRMADHAHGGVVDREDKSTTSFQHPPQFGQRTYPVL